MGAAVFLRSGFPMRSHLGLRLAIMGGLAVLPAAASAGAVDLAAHRAHYAVSMGSAKPGSGVVAVDGSMTVETGETCDGWTTEQRNKFTVHYTEDNPDLELSAVFVSWESKDGRRFRFSQRETKNGELDKEVSGAGQLGGKGKGGTVSFTKPNAAKIDLAPGVMFPTAHTALLIERALAGEGFVGAKVFDGTSDDNASDVTAVIGAPQDAAATAAGAVQSPLLQHPSWRVHLAFFPAESTADQPDFELTMRLLDNGVSGDSLLDYGDFAIRAKLDKIEALPKPSC
jgi:envelope integrity protein B